MAEYLHGAYGQINAVGTRVADASQGAIVYIGTAPVHTIEDGAKNVNVPVLINNIAEARQKLGYSEDWASYTLCEAMHVHFENKGVGPLVFINVLDPQLHVKLGDTTTESKTPSDGKIMLSDGNLIDTSTIEVATKTLDTDYTVSLDTDQNKVVLTEKTAGGLGNSALNVSYKKMTVISTSKTPSNGTVTITDAEDIILDTVVVSRSGDNPEVKVKGTDYSIAYNIEKKNIVIKELTSGALGTTALTVTYRKIDASSVTAYDVIGSSDGLGLNKGVFAVKDVYQVTGYIPSFLVAPGFSCVPAIHAAMYQNSVKINSHWDAYMFVDLPIVNGETALTFDTIAAYKSANNYNKENETVYFPLATGIDGKTYHLSTLAAANFQELLIAQDGIPYRTASNTACALIENLYLGEAYVGRIFDDYIINEKLNKNGIASAAYVGGRWAIWGAHSADYDQTNATQINVAETNRMMLYYISNDFQDRRTLDVDKPLTPNDIKAIVSEEQTRIDALLAIGALIFGEVMLNATAQARADILNGDWQFSFNVTTTPLSKSLKAIVSWTDDGFATYFEEDNA